MAGLDFLGRLGGGLMDFAGSGLGQTVIGAGAGYGLDRLTGGSGQTGALVGGVGGLLNYGSGAGGNLFGEGASDFDATALGGLFGQQGQQGQPQLVQGLGGSLVPQQTAIAQGLQPTSLASIAQPTGLLDRATAVGERYAPAGRFVGDIGQAYGNIQQGLAQRDLAESEIDYRNRIAALQEENFLDQQRRQRATETNIASGFGKSSLSNYYSA